MGTSAPSADPGNELHRLVEEQAALRRVATLVASGASSTEVFEAVAQEVGQVLQLPNTAVCRYEDEGAAMTVLAAFGDGPEVFSPGSRWPLDGPSMSAEVFRTGNPARFEEYRDLPGSLAAAAREHGFDRVAGAPIIVDGRVWGVISTSSPDAPLPDNLEDRLAEFTELVATAIANSEAHEQLTRLAEEQAALRRVATLVAAGAPPAEVFEAVSAEVAALLGADGSAVSRYEADGTVTAVSGWTAEGGYSYVGRRFELEGTVSGVIFETGRPGRLENYTEAAGRAPHAARAMGWRSSVGAPITVEGRLWGVLAVVSKSEQPLPGDTEQRLAEFAELFETAIANSEAHEQLAQLADEQAALRRVATLVAEGATPHRVFEGVRDEVARMFNAPLSVLLRYDAKGTATVLATSDGYLGPIGRTWAVEGDGGAIARDSPGDQVTEVARACAEIARPPFGSFRQPSVSEVELPGRVEVAAYTSSRGADARPARARARRRAGPHHMLDVSVRDNGPCRLTRFRPHRPEDRAEAIGGMLSLQVRLARPLLRVGRPTTAAPRRPPRP
jgi:GAF domain-containing protein